MWRPPAGSRGDERIFTYESIISHVRPQAPGGARTAEGRPIKWKVIMYFVVTVGSLT